MAEFKKMWTEEEIKEAAGGGGGGVENPLILHDGEKAVIQIGATEENGAGFAAQTSVDGEEPSATASILAAGDGVVLQLMGTSDTSNKMIFDSKGLTADSPMFAVTVDKTGILMQSDLLLLQYGSVGQGPAIVITKNAINIGDIGYTPATKTITVTNETKINFNLRQPSVEHEGTISETAGGTSIGTYTIKYTPTYDTDGAIVGGCGTIALNFTAASSAETLYLANSDTLPNLTGVVKAATGAMSMICVEGASGNASTLTLQGGIAGAIVVTTLEGGINVYSN